MPFLENTSEELILYNVFNMQVINVEVLHKTLSNFKRDFRVARSRIWNTKEEWGIYTSLVSELQSLRRTSYVLGCLAA